MDTNALSRQLAVYGAETQSKLMAMRVYIRGLRGLGIEIAKNLILAGPKLVALDDSHPVRIEDLGANFYLTQDHVSKISRSQAVKPHLENLNPNVTINIVDNLTIDYISSNFNVVVITDAYDRNQLVALNNACRAKGVGFIYAGNLGLYGFTFIDFGDSHRVHDLTGQQNKTAIIVGISNDQEGLVYSHEDKRHGFEDGDTISFKQVKGMTQVNGKQFKITVKSPHSFTIGDTSKFSPYQMNGIAEQVKVPIFMKFNSLEKSLSCPYAPDRKELDLCNWQKIGRAEELHIILNALHIFNARHNRLPYNLHQEDANELVSIVQSYLNESKQKMQIEGQFRVEKVDQQLIRNVSKYADTQISPVCSFWGGIVTQQIVKFTGKYSPLRQWLHHDFLQVLPNNVHRVSTNHRYSDYSVLFGHEFVEAASKINTFLVGAGALGCEFIKMFALMGLATHPKATITCTDDDNIQISNLNRQFLFRKENVGGNKSQVACGVGKKMNPHANFRSLKLRVDPDNQQIFNDQFWDSLDFVVNAVDNVKARLYVDGRCVWYGKTLFESGTLGTKCNSQVIVPKFTQSYGDSQDPAQQTIPLCTLKNFPYQIQHTIQWARDYFEGIFSEGPSETHKFTENPTEYLNKVMKQLKSKPVMLRARLQTIKRLSAAQQKFSYQACVQLAKNMFQDIFYNQIAQLLHSFPSNHTTQNGKLFWSGLKREPVPIKFDSKDPKHLEFVQSAANIFAHIFGLNYEQNPQTVGKIADAIKIPQFQPRKITIKIDQNDKTEQKEQQDEEVVERLYKQLSSVKLTKGPQWRLTEFEKDDPTNYHIEFVGSVANLRARNYKIDEVDNFKVKLIAGKIIPAIATTTAMIVGAVGVQIIKKILNAKPESYKNSFMNLALPLWVFSDPLPPIQHEDKQYDQILLGPVKAIPPKFTNWQKINVKGPLTIKELKQYFQKNYQVSLSMVSIGQVCIYNKYSPQSVKREGSDILAVYQTITKKPFPKFKKYLQMEANGETLKDGIDAIMPTVKYER